MQKTKSMSDQNEMIDEDNHQDEKKRKKIKYSGATVNKSGVISKCIKKYTLDKPKIKFGFQPTQQFFIYQQLNEKQYFHLNGDFFIAISPPMLNDDFQETVIKYMSKIEIFDKYISAKSASIQFQKDFSLPIKLLERSQNQLKHELAQSLRVFEEYSKQIFNNIQLVKYEYSYKMEDLQQLNHKREEYKQNLIHKYVNEKLTQDNFYYIANIGVNFEFMQIEIKSLNVSKDFFHLIGVDEKEINQYLLHVGLNEFIFLSEMEKFYKCVIDIIQKGGKKEYVYQDFTLLTLDRLKLYCDVKIQILDIQYPPELQYFCNNNYYNCQFDQIVYFNYDIKPYHLKYLIDSRNQNQNIEDSDLTHSQSFEYSILSTMLLDKYYPNNILHFKALKDDKQKFDQNKQCGYKYIS